MYGTPSGARAERKRLRDHLPSNGTYTRKWTELSLEQKPDTGSFQKLPQEDKIPLTTAQVSIDVEIHTAARNVGCAIAKVAFGNVNANAMYQRHAVQ